MLGSGQEEQNTSKGPRDCSLSVERGSDFSLVSHVLHFEKMYREQKEKANKILPYFFWHHKSDMMDGVDMVCLKECVSQYRWITHPACGLHSAGAMCSDSGFIVRRWRLSYKDSLITYSRSYDTSDQNAQISTCTPKCSSLSSCLVGCGCLSRRDGTISGDLCFSQLKIIYCT